MMTWKRWNRNKNLRNKITDIIFFNRWEWISHSCGFYMSLHEALEKELATTPVLLPGKSHGWKSLVGYSPWGRRVGHNWMTSLCYTIQQMGFPGGSEIKNPPAKQETWVWSPCWKDPPEEIWQPAPVILPGKFHGLRSLVGYSPWGRRVGHDWAASLSL